MIAWAVETVVATTVLMAAVLLIRRPVREAFGARVAYLLWLLPALRMVLPPLPASWREHAATPLSAVSDTLLVYVAPTAEAAPVASGFDPLLAVGLFWLAGAGVFFAWHCVAHLLFVRRMLALPNFRRPLGGGAELVETQATAGPVAFGVLQRFVAVPRDFSDRYDADERALAIAHELSHHARGDLIANWAALAMLAVHWPNPLAWVAYRAFRADQEMANDARVLADRNAADRHAYARAIVKAAHGGAVSAVCHLHTIDDLKGRLRMLTQRPKSRRTTLAGTAGVAMLTSAAMTLTASGTAAAEKVREVAEAMPAIAPIVALQSAPAVSPTPATVPVDAAKPEPVKKVRKEVIVLRDGKVVTYHSSDDDHRGLSQLRRMEMPRGALMIPLPPTPPSAPSAPTAPSPPNIVIPAPPEVVDGGDCARYGDKKGFVVNENDGKHRRVVICSKRIEKHVEAAAAASARAHEMSWSAQARTEFAESRAKMARARALSGLKSGRAAIQGDRNLSDGQRRRALDGIDQAIREMEASEDES